jgi:signal peptidase I
VKEGRVWVNGAPLAEPYGATPAEYTWGPAVVPPGCVFVLGDNRNASNDSHVWGFLDERLILGRAWVRFGRGRCGGMRRGRKRCFWGWGHPRLGKVAIDMAILLD